MLVGFLALPLAVRIAVVMVAAWAAARFANWAIYTWAYHRRRLGPWSPAPAKSPPRSWRDHLPVVGWFELRRESTAHGRRYWIRPLLIELLLPVALGWYYHFYVSGGSLPAGQAIKGLEPELHWQFSAHFVLVVLMCVATFIDFDEQSIPDAITVSGTVLGLFGAALADRKSVV